LIAHDPVDVDRQPVFSAAQQENGVVANDFRSMLRLAE